MRNCKRYGEDCKLSNNAGVNGFFENISIYGEGCNFLSLSITYDCTLYEIKPSRLQLLNLTQKMITADVEQVQNS